MGARCALASRLTKRSYVLGENDVGHTLGLMVRATDSRGSTTAVSSLIGPIGGAPPLLVSTAQPTVSGEAVPGSMLKVDPGTWSPVPESFSYQWARCTKAGRACAPIAGATAETYAVRAGDLGHALVAIVQARSGATSQAVFSVATTGSVAAPAPAPVPRAPETVTGPLELCAAAGRRRHPAGQAADRRRGVVVRLRRDQVRLPVVPLQHGRCALQVDPRRHEAAPTRSRRRTWGRRSASVCARPTRTGTTNAYASLVGPVAGPTARLVSTGQPTVTGVPKEGQALAGLGRQLEPDSGDDRVPVAALQSRTGASASRSPERPRAPTRSRRLTPGTPCARSSTRGGSRGPGRASASRLPPSSPPRRPARRATRRPPRPGRASRETAHGHRPDTGRARARSATATSGTAATPRARTARSVHGATRPTYTLVAKDVGHTLGFAVHATDATGTATAYASLVGPIAGPTSRSYRRRNRRSPALARQGQTLQVSDGAWSQKPTSLTYAWQRCNANGRLCIPIAGATAATYAVTAADAGHRLAALVQAAANGVAQATLSVATPVVS